MKTLLKILGGVAVFLIVVVLLVAGYFGFIPGLSSIFGADKPRDLGIRYTEVDRTSGREKSKIEYVSLPKDTPDSLSIQRFGQRQVSTGFTSKEITALLNNRPWKFWPYSDMQIRFNKDGSAEVSGKLIKNRIPSYAAAIGIPKEAVTFAMKFLPYDPVFYVKGKAALVENKISVFEPQNFELGRIPLPVGIFLAGFPINSEVMAASPDMINELSRVQNKKDLIINYINSRLSSIQGFYAKEAYFDEDRLFFQGSLPEKEATVR